MSTSQLSQDCKARLVALIAQEEALSSAGGSDRHCNVLRYLMRRSFRPLHDAMRAEYRLAWGRKCSFSYFGFTNTENELYSAAYQEARQ